MRIVAAFGWRWEPEWLVEELRQNLAWVDGFAMVDDRNRDGAWGHEGEYRRRQLAEARKLDADWMLITSPDERWEDSTEEKVRGLMTHQRPVAYKVRWYDMWTPTHYRVDGLWGRRSRPRLFPLRPGTRFQNRPIHNPSWPVGYKTLPSDLLFYHLKNMTAENREFRAETFQALDDHYDRQRRGFKWSYLTDDTGIQLRSIEPGREFSPPITRAYDWKQAVLEQEERVRRER